jgi:hypothetical protein
MCCILQLCACTTGSILTVSGYSAAPGPEFYHNMVDALSAGGGKGWGEPAVQKLQQGELI